MAAVVPVARSPRSSSARVSPRGLARVPRDGRWRSSCWRRRSNRSGASMPTTCCRSSAQGLASGLGFRWNQRNNDQRGGLERSPPNQPSSTTLDNISRSAPPTPVLYSTGEARAECVIESFNGKFNDECLNEHWFLPLQEAQLGREARRRKYNKSDHPVRSRT
jgi:hypothetical protein